MSASHCCRSYTASRIRPVEQQLQFIPLYAYSLHDIPKLRMYTYTYTLILIQADVVVFFSLYEYVYKRMLKVVYTNE